MGGEIINGQFHGKHKWPAIRLKNPLSLSVEVTILDGKGFVTCRTLRPGTEVYVKVPHQGDYDIEPKIIRYDQTGQPVRLGDASWQKTPVPAARGQPVRKQPMPGPILLSGVINVKSRRWRTVAAWPILQGFTGKLRAINIQLVGDCEAQVILPNDKPQTVRVDATLTWQTPVLLYTGQAVRVKARSRIGNSASAQVIIQGELFAMPIGPFAPVARVCGVTPCRSDHTPEHITEEPREREGPPLRSLGDMIDEMRKREEVKV